MSAQTTLTVVENQVSSSSFYETTPTLGSDGSNIVVYTARELLNTGLFDQADIYYQPLVAGQADGPARQVTASLTDDNLNDVHGDYIVYTAFDGYSIYSPEFIRQGIEAGSWDAGRFDATKVGGISKALELLMIANDAGMSMEIQSWGHSLAQAANLHLVLANERTRYFEAPMPKEAFEFGVKNGNLLEWGRVVAPEGPGLGIEVGWDRLATADFYISSE